MRHGRGQRKYWHMLAVNGFIFLGAARVHMYTHTYTHTQSIPMADLHAPAAGPKQAYLEDAGEVLVDPGKRVVLDDMLPASHDY
eukprot:966040-Pelagomonas_calceolata.AAC.5